MEDPMAARMRHIALLVTDPEASAKFFEEAFGMKRAGPAGRGLYMSDGVINIALLKVNPEKEKAGIFHFGMWVDDLDGAMQAVEKAGGSYMSGRPDGLPNTFYEVKCQGPDGILFDLTHSGWRGAVKEVVPAPADVKEPAE
jgi:lactoylglutathione lyase